MPGPQIHARNLKYRNYLLQVVRQDVQWTVQISPTQEGLPSLAEKKGTVRGWDQDEVVSRAKSRVDDLLEHR
jgi:hypothetical protein